MTKPVFIVETRLASELEKDDRIMWGGKPCSLIFEDDRVRIDDDDTGWLLPPHQKVLRLVLDSGPAFVTIAVDDLNKLRKRAEEK